MKNINIERFFKSKNTGNIVILMASILLLYLLISVYFTKHFFFNTVINGADVSLKSYDDSEHIIRSYIKDYKLQLVERNGEVEAIIGQNIGMEYNEKNSISKIYHRKNPFKWIISLLKDQKYYVNDLFIYNKDNLENKINQLNCLNKAITESKNVSFKYSNGSYEVIGEVYGNKINKDKLNEAIKMSILEGETKLDLNEKFCYENPKYTLSSDKTSKTKNLLNKYVSTKITYIFGNENEILGGNIINEWLSVDENLEAVINEKAVKEYVQGLSKKYDTVGIARNFKTSTGKVVEVKGGLYGWKINSSAETKALLENIKLGEILKKEPIYIQKALSRGEDEIGNTYVEINITRQHLWFYKEGKLITQGDVVTGNPNRGSSTVLGTYMLNYKQNGATLSGPNYEAEVTYWMPFYGNIGIHDASWRYSFGGEIYKRNGSHGCVNAPLYLAKIIFDNIEDGTPIISYEE
ncbi:L,D-transpeptidase family protein [Clostridium magnum]|uniref:Putative peptidoglycan binding domain protein n=1 Tax=Clostridium magnum DSM 2767 TaxID=1121326 RepID=A0A161WU52_9CLOT|nr:peptidoglycan binding domain-containing protein [Clostridium magnum]KZL90388.1 putative peptidoglycan binding domain protein [Clostridium magnum DSM 2767]SHH83903.1 L,D-transpeptidase catalytic domain [Clostridium magnum DSM 2767]